MISVDNNMAREMTSFRCCVPRPMKIGQPITKEHIYAELITFLFAGHETTALTLTWAVYHLLRNKEVLSKLTQELDSLDDNSPAQLASAPYLKAVVQETLRVHPIVTETLRKLNAPLELDGYNLPAGIAVAPATVLAHYNANVFEEPEQFALSGLSIAAIHPFNTCRLEVVTGAASGSVRIL